MKGGIRLVISLLGLGIQSRQCIIRPVTAKVLQQQIINLIAEVAQALKFQLEVNGTVGGDSVGGSDDARLTRCTVLVAQTE